MADQLSRPTAGALTKLLDGKVQPARQPLLPSVGRGDDMGPAAYASFLECLGMCRGRVVRVCGGLDEGVGGVGVGDSTSMHHARQPDGPGFGPADEHSAVDKQVEAPEMHPCLAQAMIPHVSP